MAYGTNLRKYDRVIGGNTLRRKHKGRSKKNRRLLRADWADGWSRKQAGSMSPQHYSSKRELRKNWEELNYVEMW